MCKSGSVSGAPKTVLLATEKAFAKEAVEKIEAVFKESGYVVKKLENYKTKEELLAAVSTVDALIVRSDIVDADVVESSKNLKICVRAGAGYDNLDLKACAEQDIVAMNTPGQNANAVAELVFGMMIASARNSFDGSSGFELRNKDIAFYGFGSVARAVHQIATGFGMRSYAYHPSLSASDLASMGVTKVDNVEDLFEHHYVSLHVPMTAATKQSVTKDMLLKMPKGGTLINTARKEIIHEAQLLEAFTERTDLRFLSDVAPANAAELVAVCDKRVLLTKKKMGAQTLEANNNAGVAAANQIVGFFERGDVQFRLGASVR